MPAITRERYKIGLGASLRICVVVGVGSALVVFILGVVGGALQFPLALVSGDVEYPFRDMCLQCSLFDKIG